jgi:cellulose biosynthesis protein BcsQ
MFPHHNIHKHTWTSPDEKVHGQIDYILVDRQRHLSVLDVQSFMAADCDTDHCLVAAKGRERLAVNKQRTQRFHMERFNLKIVNEVEGKEKNCTEVSSLQLRKIWTLRRELIVLGKRLERISKLLLLSLYNFIYVDCKMKDATNFAISLSNFMYTILMAQGLLKYMYTFADNKYFA